MKEEKDILKNHTKNLTEGSPVRLLLLFSLPLMAGNIFQQFYTIVDTAIVGKVLGVEALAALGAVDWLNWLTLGVIQGFTQGFAILIAQKFGAGEEEPLRHAVANSILLSVFCGLFITAAGEEPPVLCWICLERRIISIRSAWRTCVSCLQDCRW